MANITDIIKSGSINIYVDGISLPVEAIEGQFEDLNDEADIIAQTVKSIRNKLSAIDTLFESVTADLGLIELDHFDDNGRELANKLKNRFEKLREDFYWTAIESETKDGEDGWMNCSLSTLTNLLADGNHQTLVIPQFRKFYEEVVETDNLTVEFKNEEFNKWVNYIRHEFHLSKDFK